MGYTTDFFGSINIEPPLNKKEITYLKKFASTRRVNRVRGPYYVGDDQSGMWFSDKKIDKTIDVLDVNKPPEGQPGLWCQWVPSEDGKSLQWDGGEKFYEADAWMMYLIEHFLCETPCAKILDPQMSFLKGHSLNGVIYAIGEDVSDDLWKIEVKASHVFYSKGSWCKEALNSIKESNESEYYISADALAEFLPNVSWSEKSECESTLSVAQKAQKEAVLEEKVLSKVLSSKKINKVKPKDATATATVVVVDKDVQQVKESFNEPMVELSKKTRRTL